VILNERRTFNDWGPHGKRVLGLLAKEGSASRERLHRLSGLHRNLIGDTVRRLMEDGLVHMGQPQVRGRGRPQTPVTLNPNRGSILGVAIEPGAVTANRINLLGKTIDAPTIRAIGNDDDPVAPATTLIREMSASPPLAIGVTVTGVIDVADDLLLESAVLRGVAADLRQLRDAAGDTPLILENDLQALAQHWRMREKIARDEDVLLVRLEDGAVGAAIVIQGQPHAGCVHAASEIGHTRLAIETRQCYCGRCGCLERIFDSDFANDLDGQSILLADRITADGNTADDKLDATLGRVLDLVGVGIANAVQILRPHRLLLVSQYARSAALRKHLILAVQREMLASFRNRVKLEWWDGATQDRASVAAFPALALVLGEQPAVK
jgi:predicted NBD/HSP70 family sugar kinase